MLSQADRLFHHKKSMVASAECFRRQTVSSRRESASATQVLTWIAPDKLPGGKGCFFECLSVRPVEIDHDALARLDPDVARLAHDLAVLSPSGHHLVIIGVTALERRCREQPVGAGLGHSHTLEPDLSIWLGHEHADLRRPRCRLHQRVVAVRRRGGVVARRAIVAGIAVVVRVRPIAAGVAAVVWIVVPAPPPSGVPAPVVAAAVVAVRGADVEATWSDREADAAPLCRRCCRCDSEDRGTDEGDTERNSHALHGKTPLVRMDKKARFNILPVQLTCPKRKTGSCKHCARVASKAKPACCHSALI